MTDRIERSRPGQRVVIGPNEGQSPESVEADFELSFALGDEMRADGVKEWTSHFRTFGPIRCMVYKEVGPPPWRWPRVGVHPWLRRHPCVRFIAGWHSTAYALIVMWHGREK